MGLNTFGIPRNASWIGNGELFCHIANHSHGNIDRIAEKRSEKADGSNLHAKAEAIVVSTSLSNQFPVLIIQMKIPGELFWGWFTDVASIALFLGFGKILNGHRGNLSFSSVISRLATNRISRLIHVPGVSGTMRGLGCARSA